MPPQVLLRERVGKSHAPRAPLQRAGTGICGESAPLSCTDLFAYLDHVGSLLDVFMIHFILCGRHRDTHLRLQGVVSMSLADLFCIYIF